MDVRCKALAGCEMDDAGAGWHWQVACRWVCLADRQAGRQALDWTGRTGGSARSRDGWTSKQASKQVSSQRQRQQQRAARTTTLATEPKRRSLKIWVGMQAEMERAGVVGGWATACSTNPLGCVGYRQSAWAGVVVVGRVVD